MQLNDQLKQLLRELGQSINEAVADSERINEAIARVRAAGYDIVLKLDATIGLSRREVAAARLTVQDRRLLESLHIRLEDAAMETVDEAAAPELSPQDVKFLKSLKITLDETL